MLRTERTVTEREFRVNLNNSPYFAEPPENDIVKQYLKPNSSCKFEGLSINCDLLLTWVLRRFDGFSKIKGISRN